MKKSSLVLLGIVLIIALFFYQRYYIAPSLTLEHIKVTRLNYTPFLLENNKPTIVSFYATWCPPCQQEIQWLNEAYIKYGDQYQIIVVSDEDINKLLPKQKVYEVPILKLKESRNNLGVHSIPTTYAFDQSGNLLYKHVGVLDLRELTSIQKLFEDE